MRRYRDLPIRLKLTGIILLVSSLALFTAAVIIIGYQAGAARDRAASELRGLAELIAVNSQAALEFADPDAATENLRALSARQTITSAAVYAADGTLFASYRRTENAPLPARAEPPGTRIADGYLELSHPIGLWSKPVGTVYLRDDLSRLDDLIARYTQIVGGTFGVLLLATLLLAAVLQRSISEPILNLARVAGAVTQRKDYSLRAERKGNDELGLLTDAFNQMLTEIQQQNVALNSAYTELAQRHQELQREIADRRRAEEAVRALNAELEQRVAARTEQLEAANKELEGFSYSVSHDLRAPLRGIDGFSRILQEEYGTRLDAEANRIITIVRDNCRTMGQLIDDLLAFSRLGRKPLSTEKVDMGQLVGDVIRDMANMPDEHIPAIEVEPLPIVQCDKALIRQVWFNLIANAVKFSSVRNDPKIRVWAERKEQRIVFAVSDNGVGFDMEYYDKLFGVFQRLHQAEEFAGTGVGLATVKRIVVRHGGQVWAEGKPGEGATFYFALPNEPVTAAEEGQHHA